MDYLFTAGAMKYMRGSFGGPNARDYNNIGPYAGPAGEMGSTSASDVAPASAYARARVMKAMTVSCAPTR
jgi:hypothetical protein